MTKILVINGANLNLLGTRTTDLYGKISFEQYLEVLRGKFPQIDIEYYQSNIEGEIVEAVQGAVNRFDGVVLNAGGYTHTSVVIADAVAAIAEQGVPTVEVHISNLAAREPFRHSSLITPYAVGSICGFGIRGYEIAIGALLDRE